MPTSNVVRRRPKSSETVEQKKENYSDGSSDNASPKKENVPTDILREPSASDSTNKEEEKFDDAYNEFYKSQTKQEMTFVVTKWAILRLLAYVYFVAFFAAWNQNRGLMGQNGLQPAMDYWPRLQAHLDTSPWHGFLQYPSLFWWIPLGDSTMDGVAMLGMVVSFLALTGVYVSWLSIAILWLVQFSLINMSAHTAFYQYGWESQLLETGVLALFLCELPGIQSNGRLNLAIFPRHDRTEESPSKVILWLFRWLSFRISLGAGLIKVRGSSCWTHKTCLWYHFETQPIPSPFSFFFHFLPKSTLSQAVDLDLFVQLYTSWMALLIGEQQYWLIRTIVRMAGWIQTGFMVNIMLSGNFSFLNHLTIVPALACLDDDCWPTWTKRWIVPSYVYSPRQSESVPKYPKRWLIDLSFFGLIAFLSWPVIANLLQHGGSRQIMNGSFDNFRLVNTYGAFGDVGKQRFEPIVSVSPDGSTWHELEFPCKPGTLTRRPCFCAPYHYRVDWNIWFLGFPPHSAMLQRRETWLYRLLERLLESNQTASTDRPWHDLLDSSSAKYLKQNGPMRYAKVDMYLYRMAAPLSNILQQYWNHYLEKAKSLEIASPQVMWWNRTYSEPLIPVVRWDPQQKLVRVQDKVFEYP